MQIGKMPLERLDKQSIVRSRCCYMLNSAQLRRLSQPTCAKVPPSDSESRCTRLAILSVRYRMLYFRVMKIQFTTQVFREGRTYVGYTPELDVSSCATTEAKAQKNLLEAVRLFLEEAEKMGSLDQILKEAGFVRHKEILVARRPMTTRRVTVPLSILHA
jgi:hypothetical protein